MRKLFILTLLALSLSSCSTWSTSEKVLAGTFLAGQAVNYGQANWTLTEPNWHEVNPIIEQIGTNHLLAWKLGTSALTLSAAHLFPKWRKPILVGASTIVWGFVFYDLSQGVGWRW